MQQMTRVKRGTHIRRTGRSSVCSIGPFFSDQHSLYFFTVEHGIGGMGDRGVEVTIDGFNWVPVGTYIVGVQNDTVDWALVRLNENIGIEQTIPDNLADPATGIGYDYQSRQYTLFTSQAAPRANLQGGVNNSPTYRDQYQCLTQGGAPRANEGDSGMAVYDRQKRLVGIEWAIFWNGPQQQHTFYVQPFPNVAQSVIATVRDYDQRYRASAAPALVWSFVKPLADTLQANAGTELDFFQRYTI